MRHRSAGGLPLVREPGSEALHRSFCLSRTIRNASLAGAVALWIALSSAPWQGAFEGLPWVRAGLGLLLFIVPGGCLQQLAYGDRSWTRFYTCGGVTCKRCLAQVIVLSLTLARSLSLFQTRGKRQSEPPTTN